MRSGLNQIVVLVVGVIIFVTGSTAIIALAQEPSNLPQENSGAITVNVDPAVFESQFYAKNPELMAAQRVAADNVPTQSESQFYAENPELLAAHRVEVGSRVDNALDQDLLTRATFDYPVRNQLGTQDLKTKPHHPRLRGMQVH
ncbi:MAG: hypothetical protein KDI79_11700 [Anaerolineae bacterium]|nr:hypothetical protein [Anaerolineae bacterium]